MRGQRARLQGRYRRAEDGFDVGGAVEDEDMRALAAEGPLFFRQCICGGAQVFAALVRQKDEVEGTAQRTEEGVLKNARFRLGKGVVAVDLPDNERQIARDAEAPELAFGGRAGFVGGKGEGCEQIHRAGELRRREPERCSEVCRPVGGVGRLGG